MTNKEMADFLMELSSRHEMPINEDEYYLLRDIADRIIELSEQGKEDDNSTSLDEETSKKVEYLDWHFTCDDGLADKAAQNAWFLLREKIITGDRTEEEAAIQNGEIERRYKVKILITKSSNWEYKEVKEYENLESCVDELLSRDELYHNNTPEVVVYKERPWLKYDQDVDYIVEIYDTWRE